MVYLQLTMELPRNKVREAWQFYKNKIQKFDKECVEKVGGKYIGYWATEYGKIGEITVLVAYNNLEDRERLLELFFEHKDEKFQKDLEEWLSYTPTATVKVMRPLPGSPLQ